MNHDVGTVRPALAAIRRREAYAQHLCDRRAARVDVDEFDVTGGYLCSQPCRQAADRPAANHDRAIAEVWAGVPQAIDGRFEVGRQHGSGGSA